MITVLLYLIYNFDGTYCVCLVAQLCPTPSDPLDCSPPPNPAPATLSIGFFRQEYWSGLTFLPPGHLLHSGVECMSPMSPALQVDFLPPEPLSTHAC